MTQFIIPELLCMLPYIDENLHFFMNSGNCMNSGKNSLFINSGKIFKCKHSPINPLRIKGSKTLK